MGTYSSQGSKKSRDEVHAPVHHLAFDSVRECLQMMPKGTVQGGDEMTVAVVLANLSWILNPLLTDICQDRACPIFR